MQSLTSASARYNQYTNYFLLFFMDKNVIDHVFLGKWRMNRRQYWNVLALLAIVQFIIGIFLGIWAIYYPPLFVIIPWISYLLLICQVCFSFGTFIRRGHDINFSTRFTLLWFWLGIILNILYSITQQSPIIFWILMLTMIYPFMLAFKPWKEDVNQYWEQPKNLKKVSEIFRFWWTGKS